MNRIDYSNLGGMPFTQNRADFMQQSYLSAFSAIAKLCGDKTILHGVVSDGTNVTDGWISYNGELIRFIGSALGVDVVISETAVPFTFADNIIHDVQFTKTATCGSSGDFPFTDLVPLSSLINIWTPGSIRELYVDNTYIATNFDSNGFGLNKETGWRIFSKVVPTSAGKVFVNLDGTQTEFNLVGKTGGTKTVSLTGDQNGPHTHTYIKPVADGSATGAANNHPDGPLVSATTSSSGLGSPHNNLQPYFVILKLVKL